MFTSNEHSDFTSFMINFCRCTPLHNAAGKGFSDIVQLLVEAGADVLIRADKVMLLPIMVVIVKKKLLMVLMTVTMMGVVT